MSVHDHPNHSDPEKQVYLQQSPKNRSAKNALEGFSHSGEYYTEAVECVKYRYDCSRLIHQTHVHMCLEATPLKEGSSKELCGLPDMVQQHL